MPVQKFKKSRANTHSRRANWKGKTDGLVVATAKDGRKVEVPTRLARAVKE
jgi:large subunit ribosomal protein L32